MKAVKLIVAITIAAVLSGCVVYPASELVAPGVIKHIEGERFPLGELDGSRSARVEAMAARDGIGLVKLMGRHSGFLACQAALASTAEAVALHRALAEHRPLGDVQRARKAVYFRSQQGRGAA